MKMTIMTIVMMFMTTMVIFRDDEVYGGLFQKSPHTNCTSLAVTFSFDCFFLVINLNAKYMNTEEPIHNVQMASFGR